MRLPKNVVLKLMARAFEAGVRQGEGGSLSPIEEGVRDEFVRSLFNGYIGVVERKREAAEGT